MLGDGGIHECAYAQNCVQICPKGIPRSTRNRLPFLGVDQIICPFQQDHVSSPSIAFATLEISQSNPAILVAHIRDIAGL
jgi:hypothetical protein